MFNKEEAINLLKAADLFFDDEDFESKYVLNMNDVWGWACADGEEVPEDKLIEVAELFWQYGWAGILYWVSRRNNDSKSEFADVNRFIDFVVNEERIKQEFPDPNIRAYIKATYTL